MNYPATYRYTKDHEWIDVKGEFGTIGLTDYAQRQLGDVVFVELPSVGATLVAGKALGTVESVKSVNDIFAPVSGEVTEVNAALEGAPEKVNSDPHGTGWLVKVHLRNPSEIGALMDAPSYESYISASEKEDSH